MQQNINELKLKKLLKNKNNFPKEVCINGLDRPPHGVTLSPVSHRGLGLVPAHHWKGPGLPCPPQSGASLGVTGTVEQVAPGLCGTEVAGVTENVTDHSCIAAFLIHNKENKMWTPRGTVKITPLYLLLTHTQHIYCAVNKDKGVKILFNGMR